VGRADERLKTLHRYKSYKGYMSLHWVESL
jgi:hypothetical protein